MQGGAVEQGLTLGHLCSQVHIEFTDGEERISLEGPTEEVEQAQAQIQEIIKDLVSDPTKSNNHTLYNPVSVG